ncbi:hypothetical protein EVAR_35535_1 [Eumeta japonica]|uniref:Uncharacterized protein n=1 Tax=Eumeta variegata TaxID=151549 RepID=A0A4C1X4U1_EUMVA|nr:hypothetical protein EVAR_35535_1 [Eumeta japonica]
MRVREDGHFKTLHITAVQELRRHMLCILCCIIALWRRLGPSQRSQSREQEQEYSSVDREVSLRQRNGNCNSCNIISPLT